jgi:hypothetical protein
MTAPGRRYAWLLAAGLLGAAPPAPAADADRYLPHDTNLVLILNVKQVRSWPPFQRQYKEQLEKLLEQEPARQILKGTSFDPLKDLDRVVIAEAKSSTPVRKSGESAPVRGGPSFLLLEGRFDRAKLRARAAKAARAMPKRFQLSRMRGMEVLVVNGPAGEVNVALLDEHTLMISSVKLQADEALGRAASKSKAGGPEAREVKDWLAKADAKAALRLLATATAGAVQTRTTATATSGDGKTDTIYTDVKQTTFKELGISEVHGKLLLADDGIELEGRLAAADRAKAEDLAGKMNRGLEEMIRDGGRQASPDPVGRVVVEVCKTVKVTAKGKEVTVKGRAAADVFLPLVRALLEVRPGPPPRLPKGGRPR